MIKSFLKFIRFLQYRERETKINYRISLFDKFFSCCPFALNDEINATNIKEYDA